MHMNIGESICNTHVCHSFHNEGPFTQSKNMLANLDAPTFHPKFLLRCL